MTTPDPITPLITELQELVAELREIVQVWPYLTEAERRAAEAAKADNEDDEQ